MMFELQSLLNLIERIKNDESFRKRNISELIQNIPYIGGFITANTINAENDKILEKRLLELEKISTEALTFEESIDIVNIIEQNTITNSILLPLQKNFLCQNLFPI